MSRSRLLVIQLSAAAPLGPLGDWFAEAGAEVDMRILSEDSLPDSVGGHDGFVLVDTVLAGDLPQPDRFAAVRPLLRSAISAESPTLCIGAGAQLLALSAGGQPAEGGDELDISPAILAKRDAAWVDPLSAELPLMQDVLHVSAEELVRLPDKAVLLSSSPRYPNQAFRLGRCAYGLPFHIETTPEIVQYWTTLSAVAFNGVHGEVRSGLLTQLHADIAETWRPFAHRFVDLASGTLEPAKISPRTLPLAHG